MRAKTKITMDENEVNSELSDELHEAQDEIKQLRIEQKFFNALTEIKELVISINEKVKIHNNYELRISDLAVRTRKLEQDKSKFYGIIITVAFFMTGVGMFLAKVFWK